MINQAAFLVAVASGLLASGCQSDSDRIFIDSVARTGADRTYSIYVRVLDDDQRPIKGLHDDQFTIEVNGERLQPTLQAASLGFSRLPICIVVDQSIGQATFDKLKPLLTSIAQDPRASDVKVALVGPLQMQAPSLGGLRLTPTPTLPSAVDLEQVIADLPFAEDTSSVIVATDSVKVYEGAERPSRCDLQFVTSKPASSAKGGPVHVVSTGANPRSDSEQLVGEIIGRVGGGYDLRFKPGDDPYKTGFTVHVNTGRAELSRSVGGSSSGLQGLVLPLMWSAVALTVILFVTQSVHIVRYLAKTKRNPISAGSVESAPKSIQVHPATDGGALVTIQSLPTARVEVHGSFRHSVVLGGRQGNYAQPFLLIPNEGLQPVHAEIVIKPGQAFLRNLAGRDVLIDGRPVSTRDLPELKTGSIFQVGLVSFTVSVESE